MAAATEGLISGRYRLGELLGTGGSASVFAAVDTRSDAGTGASVALKILHPHLSRSDRSREAFFAEARAAAVLRHPNIVAVLGVGVHDAGEEPLAWIALELAPGVSLAEHVEKNGALVVGGALTVAAAVLLALAATHRNGLIHRDISPANIMVEPAADGTILISGVRLLDFGLADAAGRPVLGADVVRSPPGPGTAARREVGVLGSANFMSPEQAQGRSVDERGDIYQLGGVLHFALTGRPPFPRDSTSAVLRAHVQSPPPVPSVLRPGIPREVDRIVVKAMLKDPASRYRSAREMGEAIAAVRPVGPPPAGPAGDDRTRVLDADLTRTTVLVHSSVAFAATTQPSVPGPLAGRRRGRGKAVGWVAGLLVLGVMAIAWAGASAGSAQSSIAQTRTPAPVARTVPTAEPTPSVAPAESVRVPELASMPLGEARAALEAVGLRLGGLSSQDSARAGDTVLSLTPAPGAWISVGRAVDLVVASGSNGVPPVTGLPEREGIAALQGAGFVAVTETAEDGSVPAGTVLASAPGEGTVLRLGTSVTISVAASAQTPKPPTPTPTPIPTSTANPPGTPSPRPTPPGP